MCSMLKIYLFSLPLLFLVGCQPRVYLMPPPIGITAESELFQLSLENKEDNLLHTLYATNRIPFNRLDSSTGYTIFPSDTLELGTVVYSVGDEDMSWDDLYRLSLAKKRDRDLLLHQEYIREGATYYENDDSKQTVPGAVTFFDQINRAIEKSFDKDITVYVHGANSNFYRATAQGAQFFHYTGHNSIFLTFSWPSAENLFKYKTDVLHAKKTVPAFTRLIKILSSNTKARNINIIAYSAGAQVVAPGLAQLRDLYPAVSAPDLKKQLRIGEVYFASPDTAFQPFIERYLKFRNIVGRTTVNQNRNDTVLRFSAFSNGISRLGRPDANELNKDEVEIMIDALKSSQLDVIDVGDSKALNLGSSHDSWYSHPWVSNDLLLLLLSNASPEERGLAAEYNERGIKLYYFPEDYEENIQHLIKEQKEKIEKRNRLDLENEQ